MNLIKSSDDLLCLNTNDVFGNPLDLSIYGGYKYSIYRSITILYRPCIPTNHSLAQNDTKCVIEDIHNQT